ncbi:hypothetical protein M5K25_006592 [Dendrobium thyrsiflorum]|uniref:Uncharacterized protein n=1 Tax=Dendrobium thyrsiflorum TaxID=117978 RepID=A0ABD0VJ16_DENTH
MLPCLDPRATVATVLAQLRTNIEILRQSIRLLRATVRDPYTPMYCPQIRCNMVKPNASSYDCRRRPIKYLKSPSHLHRNLYAHRYAKEGQAQFLTRMGPGERTISMYVTSRDAARVNKMNPGRGTCPLTGGFAAKWHRRINGYDSGPSEPGDSPSNGITILWLWPAPANIQPRSTRYPWTKQPMAADKDPSVSLCILKVWGDVSDSDH